MKEASNIMSTKNTAQPSIANEHQPVTDPAGLHAIFIVLNIAQRPESASAVRGFCEDFAALIRSANLRDASRSVRAIMGFGSNAWDRLFGSPRPAKLHVLPEYRGDKHTAPSTPGDIFFHLRANTMDLCFELARQIMVKLGGDVEPVDEVHGFRYFDARSMVGFVDGTENPTGDEAYEFAVVGEEDPEFSGGSYVIVQKYLHNMDEWNKLPVEEQERAIGRRKFDDIELDDDVKPANAHNAVTNIADEDGNELKIVRDNLPFGSPSTGEFGTYFLGYARNPEVTERMLSNMFIGDPPGNYDRLLDFSTAITGTLFFIPSVPLLESLAERESQAITPTEAPIITPEDVAENPAPVAPAAPAASATAASKNTDGSLSIGSLKQNPQNI